MSNKFDHEKYIDLILISIAAIIIPVLIILFRNIDARTKLDSEQDKISTIEKDLDSSDDKNRRSKKTEDVSVIIPDAKKEEELQDTNIKSEISDAAENEKQTNYQTINYQNQEFNTYIVDLSESDIAFNSKTKSGKRIKSIKNFKKYLAEQNKKLIFATNGGMFHPDFATVGLYVENGKELSPVNLEEGKGNFFLKPNGIFYIDKNKKAGIIESTDYNKIKGKIKYATQSGPLLLINGKVHEKFGENSPNKHIRNGVGLIDSNTIVFIISKKPVNFYDLAMLFKEKFNCENALYLDGYVSEMYLPELKLTETEKKFSVIINETKNSK